MNTEQFLNGLSHKWMILGDTNYILFFNQVMPDLCTPKRGVEMVKFNMGNNFTPIIYKEPTK